MRATSGSTSCPASFGWCWPIASWCFEPGEAAEFDTRVPHGIGNAGSTPVEILNLFGVQGERVHVRAAPADRRPARPAG
jgi:hypothetical protein